MLTKLEILQWEDVEPFLAQFDSLDADGSGHLDKADLQRMQEEMQRKADQAKQRKLAAKAGAPAPGEAAPRTGKEQWRRCGSSIHAIAMANRSIEEGNGGAGAVAEYDGESAAERAVRRAGGRSGSISSGGITGWFKGRSSSRNSAAVAASTQVGTVVDDSRLRERSSARITAKATRTKVHPMA